MYKNLCRRKTKPVEAFFTYGTLPRHSPVLEIENDSYLNFQSMDQKLSAGLIDLDKIELPNFLLDFTSKKRTEKRGKFEKMLQKVPENSLFSENSIFASRNLPNSPKNIEKSANTGDGMARICIKNMQIFTLIFFLTKILENAVFLSKNMVKY